MSGAPMIKTKPAVHAHGTTVYISSGQLSIDEIRQFLEEIAQAARIVGYIAEEKRPG